MKDDLPEQVSLEFLHLTLENVHEIIVSMDGERAVIVGGQALGIWCDKLLDPDTLEEVGGPVTSKDMDYYGSRDLAEVLAEKLGGRVEYPDPKDVATPQNAIVLYERDGRTMQIDILGRLAGIHNKEIEDGYLEIGYDENHFVLLLSPIQVLKTRISGIITLRRRDHSAVRQMRIAPYVMVAFIARILRTARQYRNAADADAFKEAMSEAQMLIRELIRIGSSSELDMIYHKWGIDLLAHALSLENDEMWHPKFKENQISNAARAAMEKRDRRISERFRRDPDLWKDS